MKISIHNGIEEIQSPEVIQSEFEKKQAEAEKINSHWAAIAEILGLKIVDTMINLYENSEGKFVLTKYGFIKQIK